MALKGKHTSYFGNVAGDRYTVEWKAGGESGRDVFKLYDISSLETHKDMGCSDVDETGRPW